jgi:hypothetical protein
MFFNMLKFLKTNVLSIFCLLTIPVCGVMLMAYKWFLRPADGLFCAAVVCVGFSSKRSHAPFGACCRP